MDPVSVVGLVASIVALIDKTIEVVKYLNDVNDAPQEWTAFAQEASNLLSILTTLRYTVGDATVDDPWFAGVKLLGKRGGPLDQFHEALTELTKRLNPQSNGIEFKRRLLWSFDKKYITEKFQQLERLKSLVNVALSRDQIALLQTIKADISSWSTTALQSGSQVQELHNSLTDAQRQEFLNWVSPLTYSSKQTDAFSRCQAGTYQWLLALSEFQDWLSNSDSILWGCGMPGAGKTTFTSFLVEELSKSPAKSNIRVLYVYFNYREPAQTPTNIIGALVRQLLEDGNNQTDSLLVKYESRKNQEVATLADLRAYLYDSLTHYADTFVLFDALDEYDEGLGNRSVLVDDILKLSKRPRTHVMITSRWLASLQRDLSGSSYVEIRASDSDVESYVRGQIQSSARLRGHLRQDQSLESDIVKAVVASCQGMFLLAKLHMDSLSTKLTRRSIRIALASLPRKLDETYLLVFERIENQNEDDASLAFQLLTWLTYSQRPLTVTELQHAIAVNIGDGSLNADDLVDQEVLLSVCAGIVVIEERSRVIRLIHYTTQEYLRSIRQAHPMLCDGHVYTTKVCISYLGSADSSKGTVLQMQFPFYEYAAKFWADHAKQGAEDLSQKELIGFLTDDGKVSAAAAVTSMTYGEASIRYGVHLAARLGLPITLNNMLAAGADGLRYDGFGRTPLHYACEAGHGDVVSLLLSHQHGTKRVWMAWLALHQAVSYEASELVNMILSNHISNVTGTDPLVQQHLGRTLLHRAVLAGHATIGLLLSKLPSITDSCDEFGMTALHYASLRGNAEAAETLLLHGASPNITDRYQGTPLLYAVQGDHCNIVELLVKHGATERMSDTSSSLLVAAELGRHQLVSILLAQYPTAIDTPDADGWTALHFAAVSRHSGTIDELLQRGAATGVRSHDGLTARDVAILNQVSNSGLTDEKEVEDVVMSCSDDAQTTNTHPGIVDFEEKAVALLINLVQESKDFVDYSMLADILEMNDGEYDEDSRFAYTIFFDSIIQGTQGVLGLEKQLFLGDIQGVYRDWDNYKVQSEIAGFTSTCKLWNEIQETLEGVRTEQVPFQDAIASDVKRLIIQLSDAYHRDMVYLRKLGKLPYTIGEQFDKMPHLRGEQAKLVPESSTAPVAPKEPSGGALPQRRRSM